MSPRELNATQSALMESMAKRGIIILLKERINVGLDLMALGLVMGEECKIFGEPCLALYGFTPEGFKYLRASTPKTVTSKEAFDEPARHPSMTGLNSP